MKTVCLIEGSKKKRREFLDKLKGSLSDHELFIYDENDHYERISQEVSELSCFSQQRLFIIKDIPKIDIKGKSSDNKSQARTKVLNNFKKLIPTIPSGNIVVFDNLGISSAPFLKIVEEYGIVKKFKQKVPLREAASLISYYFKDRGMKVSDSSLSLMVSSLSLSSDDVDVDQMDLLMHQVYNIAYGKEMVEENDVFSICSASKAFIIWSLYNILDGSEDDKYVKSFSMAYNFINNARYPHYELTSLISSMLWRYSLILIAKNSLQRGLSKKDTYANISNIKKLQRSGSRYKIVMSLKDDSPEYSTKMISSIVESRGGNSVIDCYSYERLKLIHNVLTRANTKFRLGCKHNEMISILQIILLTICGELDQKRVQVFVNGNPPLCGNKWNII